jgi:hypothetical protein
MGISAKASRRRMHILHTCLIKIGSCRSLMERQSPEQLQRYQFHPSQHCSIVFTTTPIQQKIPTHTPGFENLQPARSAECRLQAANKLQTNCGGTEGPSGGPGARLSSLTCRKWRCARCRCKRRRKQLLSGPSGGCRVVWLYYRSACL